MKTYLVTGGAGFMGSNFVRSIIKEKDSRVINIDNLTPIDALMKLNEIKRKIGLKK